MLINTYILIACWGQANSFQSELSAVRQQQCREGTRYTQRNWWSSWFSKVLRSESYAFHQVCGIPMHHFHQITLFKPKPPLRKFRKHIIACWGYCFLTMYLSPPKIYVFATNERRICLQAVSVSFFSLRVSGPLTQSRKSIINSQGF